MANSKSIADRMKVISIILCGGSGSRLWPLSREGSPKQFLALSGRDSLFQQALRRTNLQLADVTINATLIVASEQHRFLALEHLQEIQSVLPTTTLLLEPVARNTAPALTLAALQASMNNEDPILFAAPSDHIISDNDDFSTTLQHSLHIADSGAIVALGVTPDRPETGYGYIKTGQIQAPKGEFDIVKFIEKPSIAKAKEFLTNGKYVWNSGIFVLKASVWLKAIKRFRPDIFTATLRAWENRRVDNSFVFFDKSLFSRIPNESIDYAVMEKSCDEGWPMKVVPIRSRWSDLGTWDAVWQNENKDEKGNVALGNTILQDTSNSLLYSENRLLATFGVDNIVAVETADAVLVVDKNKCQQVKYLVEALQEQQREESIIHRRVHRPWGWYDTIDHGTNFKVKRIHVKPGAALSLQKHEHRAEHWVVVDGVAQVTCGDKTFSLEKNQSTYIPLNEVHRLANMTNNKLEIIEVQTGDYLSEDDIIRLDDDYGR